MHPDEHRPYRGDATKPARVHKEPSWAALIPASVLATCGATEPVEQLLMLQRAIAKAVQATTTLGRLRLRLPRHFLLTLRFR
jgi:hypothetical protein